MFERRTWRGHCGNWPLSQRRVVLSQERMGEVIGVCRYGDRHAVCVLFRLGSVWRNLDMPYDETAATRGLIDVQKEEIKRLAASNAKLLRALKHAKEGFASQGISFLEIDDAIASAE